MAPSSCTFDARALIGDLDRIPRLVATSLCRAYPAHDIVRLASSLAMAARNSDLPGVTNARITEDLVAGDERAFEGAIASEDIADLPHPIRIVMKSAVKQTWRKLFDDRIGDDRGEILLGRRFWWLADDEREA
jgi:hypothetical protein